jgi:hypothetical protein
MTSIAIDLETLLQNYWETYQHSLGERRLAYLLNEVEYYLDRVPGACVKPSHLKSCVQHCIPNKMLHLLVVYSKKLDGELLEIAVNNIFGTVLFYDYGNMFETIKILLSNRCEPGKAVDILFSKKYPFQTSIVERHLPLLELFDKYGVCVRQYILINKHNLYRDEYFKALCEEYLRRYQLKINVSCRMASRVPPVVVKSILMPYLWGGN